MKRLIGSLKDVPSRDEAIKALRKIVKSAANLDAVSGYNDLLLPEKIHMHIINVIIRLECQTGTNNTTKIEQLENALSTNQCSLLKQALTQHRDTTGVKGLVNWFRKPASWTQLPEDIREHINKNTM